MGHHPGDHRRDGRLAGGPRRPGFADAGSLGDRGRHRGPVPALRDGPRHRPRGGRSPTRRPDGRGRRVLPRCGRLARPDDHPAARRGRDRRSPVRSSASRSGWRCSRSPGSRACWAMRARRWRSVGWPSSSGPSISPSGSSTWSPRSRSTAGGVVRGLAWARSGDATRGPADRRSRGPVHRTPARGSRGRRDPAR